MSDVGKCLEVWDVRTKKMDVRAGKFGYDPVTYASIFWTTKNSTIVAAFSFTGDSPKIIYEFNSSTLKTVGTPFEGHTMVLVDLALSSDDTLLVSGCYETIKLWAFESRHLLASFDVLPLKSLILSPDSRQLAFASGNLIYIYNTPTEILASSGAASDAQTNAHKNLADLLKSDATRRPGAVRRNPVTSPFISYPPRPRSPPTVNSQQSIFVHRLRKFLRLPPRVNAVANDQPRDPLDFPATSALPPNHSLLTQAANKQVLLPATRAALRSSCGRTFLLGQGPTTNHRKLKFQPASLLGLQLPGYQNTRKSMILDIHLDSSMPRRQPWQQMQMIRHPSRLTVILFQMCIGSRRSCATTRAGLMEG
ncbi:hypothetical protein BDR07DRAFT_587719 [Suillus spraguei]|nr:hypothetical protein BDR07DRAFT_587719 [Suillus spraguei]